MIDPGSFAELWKTNSAKIAAILNVQYKNNRLHQAKEFFVLGVYEARLGLVNEAMDLFKQALRVDPNHCDALYNLGSLQQAMRQKHDAVKNLRQWQSCPAHNQGFELDVAAKIKDIEEHG